MLDTAEQRELQGPYIPARRITQKQISDYLAEMKTRGCTPETIKTCRRNVLNFYQWLPSDKCLLRDSTIRWRDELLEQGYMPRTVNNRLSSVNSMLAYLNLWEYQLPAEFRLPEDDVLPELTRTEYLRLLSAAQAQENERAYLMAKVFAATGLTVHELPKLTVEAVRDGRIVIAANRTKRIIHIPGCLQTELLDFAGQEGIPKGPVFVTRSGKPVNRSGVTACIQQLATDARVPSEKCNPRCLRKLYQATKEGIQQNISLLVEQAHERLLEQEQISIGWEGCRHAR